MSMTKKLATLSVAALTLLSVATATFLPLTASANSGVSVNISSNKTSTDGEKNCGVKVEAGKTEENKGVNVKIGCEGKTATTETPKDDEGDVLPAELPNTGNEAAGLIATIISGAGLGWGIGLLIRRHTAGENA